MSSITSWLERQGFSWREFGILVLMALVANIYFLANFSPSIDDELAAVRTSSEVWIAQGRFTTYLVETLLFPQSAVPFSPYLFLAVTLALTQMLLVRAHGMAPGWATYAAYGLFVSYPSWWLIEEFAANVPSIGIGFLCVAAAACLHAAMPAAALRRPTLREAGRLLLIALLLALAAGSYQTLLLLFAGLTVGVALCRSMQQDGPFAWRGAAASLAYGGLCLLAGGILYSLLNKLALELSGTPAEYIANFVRINHLDDPANLLMGMLVQAVATYTGGADLFGAAMPAAGIALLCAAVAVAGKRRRGAWPDLLLFLGLLCTPFLLAPVVGPHALPMRAMVALPYVMWLSAVLVFSFQKDAAWWVGLAVFGVFQLQIVNLTSQYIASATLAQQHDRDMGYDIGRRLLVLRGNERLGKPILLDTYGFGPGLRRTPFAAAPSSATHGSFFGWDMGNLKRIVAYLHVLGYGGVEAVPAEARPGLTEAFEAMPAWPNEGCVRRVGDYYLLKLGVSPDIAHWPVKRE